MPRRPALPPWLVGFFLIAGTLLVYQQIWRAGFIWDDDAHLTANPCIVGPLGFAGIWTTSAATYYPLTLTSFWIQHALWGLNPWPYHLVNVLMHAASGIVLWRALRTLRIPGALLAASLWLMHPVQVESVAWITELKNTQSAFFYLLAILFFLKWATPREPAAARGSGWLYALALLCAVCAILSKSSTVMLPLVLALCWWWQEKAWRWRHLLALTPFFILSLAASAWTIWEQQYHSGALGPEWNQTLAERFVIAGKVVAFYLGKLFWPHPLIFIYPRWDTSSLQAIDFLPLAGVVVAVAIFWWWRHGWARPLCFTAAYFLLSLFPVLGFFNVYFFRYSFVGDHLQYLASIGPLTLAGVALTLALRPLGKIGRSLRPPLKVALVLAVGLLSWRQAAIYTSEEKLWRATLAQNPAAWIAHNNLGRLDRPEEAIGHYTRAIELNPAFAEAHNNLATAYLKLDRVDAALTEYRRAIELDPLYADAHHNYGSALLQLGRAEEAIPLLDRAVRIAPNDSEAQYNLGVALLNRGRAAEAIPHFQRSAELNPDDAEARQNLAWILATHPDPAVRDGQRALALAQEAARLTRNENANVIATLAAALAETGRFTEAREAATRALRLADRPLADALRLHLQAYAADTAFRDAALARP